ncbi:hypothetical protein CEXT_581851 [Caerostris extrusa]|uniref:Uncharacterized protein n=1 Tax=Caerostris extrusa TaxID=172846 RepID=A0AAV4R337_CAEEX|nr:hypothetical protein CEXT_581851 [Caerostris extrusa]
MVTRVQDCLDKNLLVAFVDVTYLTLIAWLPSKEENFFRRTPAIQLPGKCNFHGEKHPRRIFWCHVTVWVGRTNLTMINDSRAQSNFCGAKSVLFFPNDEISLTRKLSAIYLTLHLEDSKLI